MTECRLCKAEKVMDIYSLEGIPFFQNKVYSDREKAMKAPSGNVSLSKCKECGFIFNRDFDSANMVYDDTYQNEQNYSPAFDDYLISIMDILRATLKKIDSTRNPKEFKIMEIGCGKGYFLEKMRDSGLNAYGIDPAYEGEKEYIIKDYFSEKYADFNSDLIVLRHTLEHVPSPFEFIKNIAGANNYKGWIFIEVPDFKWIINNLAFWDIYYEHCNYFLPEALCTMFEECCHGLIFGGQYQYVAADLSRVKQSVNVKETQGKSVSGDELIFASTLEKYNKILAEPNCEKAVWGMGAKGVAFLNTLDSARKKIKFAIDISPKKQGQYNAGSGHYIMSPDQFKDKIRKNESKILVLVMNSNYLAEIKKSLSGTSCIVQGL